MDQKFNLCLFLSISLCMQGCATWSNRTKSIVATVGAGVVAGTIAATQAPKDEQPLGHAALWGGSTAAVTGIVSLFVFDEQAKSTEMARQVSVLQKELEVYRGLKEGSSEAIVEEGYDSIGRALPGDLKNLVSKTRWVRKTYPWYWRSTGPHSAERIYQTIDIIPSQLNLSVPQTEKAQPNFLGNRTLETQTN